MTEVLRWCRQCLTSKPFTEFYKSTCGKDGLYPSCKVCSLLRVKQWQAAHPERINHRLGKPRRSLCKGLPAGVIVDRPAAFRSQSWHISSDGHPGMRTVNAEGVCRVISLHRYIMGDPAGMSVKHKNGNYLDCRKSNLYLVKGHSLAPTCGATVKYYASSCYPGVTFHSRKRKWFARATKNGKSVYLGCFTAMEDAVEAAKNYRVLNYPGYVAESSKHCRHCGKYWPLSLFHVDNGKRDGHKAMCGTCSNSYSQARRVRKRQSSSIRTEPLRSLALRHHSSSSEPVSSLADDGPVGGHFQ